MGMVLQDWTLCSTTVIELLQLVQLWGLRESDMVHYVHRSAYDLRITIKPETSVASSQLHPALLLNLEHLWRWQMVEIVNKVNMIEKRWLIKYAGVVAVLPTHRARIPVGESECLPFERSRTRSTGFNQPSCVVVQLLKQPRDQTILLSFYQRSLTDQASELFQVADLDLLEVFWARSTLGLNRLLILHLRLAAYLKKASQRARIGEQELNLVRD
jgi:hypothetical protein